MAASDWWLEYAVRSISNRNNLCKLDDFPKIASKNQNAEIYRSMFLYHSDIVDFVADNNTVTGFNGIQSVDKLVIDIDYIKNDNNQGNQTKAKVLDVIDKMSKLAIKPEHYNLFKIPISYDELENLEYYDILDMAKEIRSDYKPSHIIKEVVKGLEPMDMSRKNIAEVRKVFDNAGGLSTRYITCVQHIYNAGYVPSNRHKHLLALVSIWRKKYAFDKIACDHLARAYMEQMDNPLPAVETSKVVSDAFKNDYNYGCNHPVLQPYCDSKCILYKWKNLDEESEMLNAEDMTSRLVDYLTADFTNKSFDLKDIFPFIPKSHIFTTGQLITLIGDTGLGKTAFYQYIITKLKNINTLFLSLEVDDITMIRRFLQATLLMKKHEVTSAFASKNSEIIDLGMESIKHIKLMTMSPDIEDLPSVVSESGAKIVVVDTIDRVKAKYAGKDEFARQEIIANGLKDLAMNEDVMVLAVHHISKSASYSYQETNSLNVHSGKGNSAIEQKSDQYISFEGRSMTKKRLVRSLKARDESTFEIILDYNWETFTFDKRN